MKIKIIITLLIFFAFLNSYAQENQFPKWSIGSVHDFEHVLTDNQITDLEILINKIQRQSKCEIIVMSINNIGNYSDFYEYALDLSNHWEIGKYYEGNGISIIFSKSLRQIRISTIDNMRGIITDQFCKEVIDDIIIPSFKNGDYYFGLNNVLLKISEELKQ
jgi:uncharacterized protein